MLLVPKTNTRVFIKLRKKILINYFAYHHSTATGDVDSTDKLDNNSLKLHDFIKIATAPNFIKIARLHL